MGRPALSTKRQARGNRDQASDLEYLYEKTMYWLYERDDPRHARRFADRIERVFKHEGLDTNNALGHEILALVAETRGEWALVARHTRSRLSLLEKLKTLLGPRAPALKWLVPPSYLAMTYDHLAVALWRCGRLRQGLAALDLSAALCRRHRVKFEGGWIRSAIECDLASASSSGSRASKSRRFTRDIVEASMRSASE